MAISIPFLEGTVERMDELLADSKGLSAREHARVMCVRLLALGWEARDVAEAVGLTRSSVYRRKAEYLSEGEGTLSTSGWGGRRGGVLSVEEEAEFVAHFEDAAREGQLVTAAVMLAELERRCGESPDPSTLYRILARHGWRKVIPRPRHPQADPERQEAFKETSQRCWCPPARTIPAHCG
jgi:transposase